MLESAERIIAALELEPLPQEGGWFRRVKTGGVRTSGRPRFTTIYALFTLSEFSALHRLGGDECFYWHGGDAFEAFTLQKDGRGFWRTLGSEVSMGQALQLDFESGDWFGGRVSEKGKFGYTLMSCSVVPGFDWKEFEIGDRSRLLEAYPEHGESIRALTR